MSGYGGGFAGQYDRFMQDVDYEARADYLLSLFERHASRPELLLDLACGTGSLSVCMARRGISVIGRLERYAPESPGKGPAGGS